MAESSRSSARRGGAASGARGRDKMSESAGADSVMELAEEQPVATPEDVIGVYRLVLRREPENEDAVAANVGRPLLDMIRVFLASDEFVHAIQVPIESGRFCAAALETPSADAAAWAAGRLPLTAAGRKRVKGADDWLTLYHGLLNDRTFAKVLGRAAPWLAERLSTAGSFQGEVWGSDGRIVSGWLRKLDSDEPAGVEVWSGDRLIGRGLASGFDRGLEQRFPGHGSHAFRVAIPIQRTDADFVVDVRAAETGRSFGEAHVRQAFSDRGAIGEVDARLDALGAELAALRASLPAMTHQIATPLERYGEHFQRWLSEPYETQPYSDAVVAVVMDATGVGSVAAEAAARAIVRQSHARLSLHLVVADDDHIQFADLAARLSKAEGMVVEAVRPGELSISSADQVHLVSAACLPHDDLVAGGALFLDVHPDVDAVYFDEDALEEVQGEGSRPRHVAPRFKPAFDGDLLLQSPYIGAAMAVRRAAWERVAPRLVFGGALVSATALALDREGLKVSHAPAVLASWQTDSLRRDDGEGWPDRVRAHLDQISHPAAVRQVADDLGAACDGRHRIVWPLPDRAAATVIIPTRDGLDLLRPCIESLLRHEADNRTIMELIVVDHESAEDETRAYLAELANRPRTSVLPFSGPFNWALMNNLAARRATGDVLVFLNNDTLVVSDGWLDELVSQASRPEVGVVGCRLIYPDGTLQHGGFVVGERRDVFLGHEGVGVPGADGGYLGRHAVVRQTSAVTGACMAVAANRFAELGGFESAAFPVDGNDVDLCFRARARGLRVLYTPYATFHHLESKTRGSGVSERQRAESRAAVDRLWRRWGERFGRDPYYNPSFDRIAEPFTRLRPPGRL